MTARILFVINHAGFFLSHRLPIALAARDAGYDVVIATPRSKHVPRVKAAGLDWVEIALSRSGRNPIRETQTLFSLYRTYRRVRPDLVHHVSSKPVLYGTPMARLARVPAVVNAISGMGHAFAEEHGPPAIVRKAVAAGYGISLRHPRMRVIFQNVEHRDEFVREGWIVPGQAVLIPGSGADTDVFVPADRTPHEVPLVVFASRLLYTKGIVDFLEAARLLSGRGVRARFVVVGEPDPDNPGSVSRVDIDKWQQTHPVEWWGRREDMPQIFAAADVVCLPSFYPEGIPKVLIEAASSGLPIVTTDTPGCREIVRDGENGLLVPIRNPAAVAEALERLLADPALRTRMGHRGRQRVLESFSLRHIIEQTLATYRELIG